MTLLLCLLAQASWPSPVCAVPGSPKLLSLPAGPEARIIPLQSGLRCGSSVEILLIVPARANKGDRWAVYLEDGDVVAGGELMQIAQLLKKKVSVAKAGSYAIVLVISDGRGQPILVQSASVELRPGILVEWARRIGGPVGAALVAILAYFGNEWTRFFLKRARLGRECAARLLDDCAEIRGLMDAKNHPLSMPEWIVSGSGDELFSVLDRSPLRESVSRLRDLIRKWNLKKFQSDEEALLEMDGIQSDIPGGTAR